MPRLSIWAIRIALSYLGIGFTLGALMLATRGTAAAATIGQLRPLHAELLLVGWMVQLALGVAYWILPRQPGAERGDERLAALALLLLNLGLWTAGLGGTFGAPSPLVMLGRAAELAAALAFAIHAWSRARPYSSTSSTGRLGLGTTDGAAE